MNDEQARQLLKDIVTEAELTLEQLHLHHVVAQRVSIKMIRDMLDTLEAGLALTASQRPVPR